MIKSQKYIGLIAALIGGVSLYIRMLSKGFVLGTTTFDHPYIEFVAALILGSVLAIALIVVLKRNALSRRALYAFGHRHNVPRFIYRLRSDL